MNRSHGDSETGVVQPSLRDSFGFVRHPALKHWAGIMMSLRDGRVTWLDHVVMLSDKRIFSLSEVLGNSVAHISPKV